MGHDFGWATMRWPMTHNHTQHSRTGCPLKLYNSFTCRPTWGLQEQTSDINCGHLPFNFSIHTLQFCMLVMFWYIVDYLRCLYYFCAIFESIFRVVGQFWQKRQYVYFRSESYSDASIQRWPWIYYLWPNRQCKPLTYRPYSTQPFEK